MDVDGKDAALSAAAPQKPDVTASLPSKEAKAPREQPKIKSKINSKIGPKISPKIAALPSSKQEAKPIVREPETPHGAMPKLESGSHSNARPRAKMQKKPAHIENRKRYAGADLVRSRRAGSPVTVRRDTRFTDIWNDKR